MALLNDPDNFTDSAADDGSTNVFINTAAQTIKLVPGQGGLVAADGALLKAVYSFIKEEWINDPNAKNLAAFDFPFVPITDEFFELKDGWNWADATTRESIRRGGWLVRNTSGNVTEHWAGLAILNAQADDQIYYDVGAGAVDFTFTGNTAEAVQVISDPNGDGNYADGFDRSTNITVYNREQGQLFSSNSSTAVGESTLLAPKLFSLSLPTGDDLNVTESDANIASQAPYTGMSITYFSTPQQRNIGGTNRDFGVIIDGNSGTAEQIYEFIQYQLRQSGDIDAGSATVLGQTASELLEFIGGAADGSGTLKTKSVTNPEGGGSGVYIDNFLAGDTNRIVFVDNLGTERTFPFVATLDLNFSSTLVSDSNPVYRVYFTDGVDAGDEFGNSGAILVDDNAGSDMSGAITGSTISLTFDYDANNQGNRTPGTPANVTVIAIGLESGQHVKATGTINRSTSNSITLTAAIERNYENAA